MIGSIVRTFLIFAGVAGSAELAAAQTTEHSFCGSGLDLGVCTVTLAPATVLTTSTADLTFLRRDVAAQMGAEGWTVAIGQPSPGAHFQITNYGVFYAVATQTVGANFEATWTGALPANAQFVQVFGTNVNLDGWDVMPNGGLNQNAPKGPGFPEHSLDTDRTQGSTPLSPNYPLASRRIFRTIRSAMFQLGRFQT